MEQRLIDANAYSAEMKTRQDALKELMDDADALDNWEMYDGLSRAFSVFVEAKLTLDAMPTVDAVQVVRCEKCSHGIKNHGISDGWVLCTKPYVTDTVGAMMHPNDWFCADGERRS
jgi:hypothetical protein